MITAITGYKRSGKDSVADAVVMGSSAQVTKVSLASPMKAVAGYLFGWSTSRIEDRKEEVDEEYGISPRQFLQVFGTEFMQLMLCEKFPLFAAKTGRKFWVKRLLKEYTEKHAGTHVVLTDLRFLHEAETLKQYETDTGTPVRILRVTRNGYKHIDTHPSEQEIPLIPVDGEIRNDGTLEELHETVAPYTFHHRSIYLAGPITGMPDLNRQAFKDAARRLSVLWDQIVSPFDVSAFEESKPWEQYMKEDIPAMLNCNAVYMLKGWEGSRGARMEHQIATELGMEVLYEEKGL